MEFGWKERALETFKNLKGLCRYYRGDFIILFHNDSLITDEQKELYIKVLVC